MKAYHSIVAGVAFLALSPGVTWAQETPGNDGPAPVDEEKVDIPDEPTRIVVDGTLEDEATPEEDPDDKIICKKDRRRTGTRIPRRTCLTANQWDLREKEEKDVLDRIGDTAGGMTGNPTTQPTFGPGG